MDETKPEQVVENEVRSNVGSSLDVDVVLRVQVPAVSDLKDVQHNHVDGRDDRVESKWSVAVRVLMPDGSSVVFAFSGRVEGVVDARHDKKKP